MFGPNELEIASQIDVYGPRERQAQRRRRRVPRASIGHVHILGGVRESLGDIEILGDADLAVDVPPPTVDIHRIGWHWDRQKNELCAYASTDRGVFKVRLPMSRVSIAFQEAAQEEGYPMPPSLDGDRPTVDGLFSKVKRAVKKTAKKVTPKPVRQIASRAQRKLTPIVRSAVRQAGRAGRQAINVASHPAFGAAMGALAVAPPLTAVGGAGLAAYAAANKAKAVLNAAEAVQRGGRAVGKAGQAALQNPARAVQTVARMRNNIRQLPNNHHGRMLAAALKSVPR